MNPRSVAFEGWLGASGTQPQGVATDGWLGFGTEEETEPRRFETMTGPGIIDPWKDPWFGRQNQEDDEVLFILAAFMAELN